MADPALFILGFCKSNTSKAYKVTVTQLGSSLLKQLVDKLTFTPSRMQAVPLLSESTDQPSRSSSGLLSAIIEFMYNSNVEPPQQRRLPELIQDYNQLQKRLQEFRYAILPFGGLVLPDELDERANGSYDALRLRILLSMHYYRLSLIMAWPVVIAFANALAENMDARYSGQPLPWQQFEPISRENWTTVQELCGMIHALTTVTEPFLHSNAAWFACNYTCQ